MHNKITLISEICCNHNGSIKLAEDMINTLANFPQEYKIDVIKFQKRTPKLILSEEEFNAPHPKKENAFAETYGLHREFLEFSVEQHSYLKKYCENKGFKYSSSVFDIQSTKDILTLKPEMIKISSANNTDYSLLRYIDDNFDGEIHISLGMTTKYEEDKIFNCIKNNRKKLILYACTSAYPTTVGNICLLEISRLKEKFGNEIKGVGFSGHHEGILPDIAAVALGATYIERHFTLDKTLKGTDQSISLNPKEFLELSKNIKVIYKDLKYKESDILDVEQDVRKRLKIYDNGIYTS